MHLYENPVLGFIVCVALFIGGSRLGRHEEQGKYEKACTAECEATGKVFFSCEPEKYGCKCAFVTPVGDVVLPESKK